MQKRKENLFSEKFRLLNSQENVEDIKWSSSESSDIENLSRVSKCLNLNNKVQRKRKRKKTGPKNISNLSITILDTSKDHNEVNSGQISPILHRKKEPRVTAKSPTFPPTTKYYNHPLRVQPSSPVLTCKVSTLQSKILHDKSPVLRLKQFSPKVSQNIRKNLFQLAQNEPKIADFPQDESYTKPTSENVNKCLLDRRKPEEIVSTSKTFSNSCTKMGQKLNHHQSFLDTKKRASFEKSDGNILQPSSPIYFARDISPKKIKIEIPESQEDVPKEIQQSLDYTFTQVQTTNTDQVKKTTYFENYFSSGNTSQTQHSISDGPTQKDYSKSSDDVEIVSIATQTNSNKGSILSDIGSVSKNPSMSSQSAEYGAEKSKKIRYKKDGLAHRLNALLKKQNANISLWQHERFLADNSNFVIPKGEHVVFLIQKVTVKFGCYLLDCIDVNDSNVLILISVIYVQDFNISPNMLFKLYEPYKILDYKENCMLIVNVCKFECIAF